MSSKSKRLTASICTAIALTGCLGPQPPPARPLNVLVHGDPTDREHRTQVSACVANLIALGRERLSNIKAQEGQVRAVTVSQRELEGLANADAWPTPTVFMGAVLIDAVPGGFALLITTREPRHGGVALAQLSLPGPVGPGLVTCEVIEGIDAAGGAASVLRFTDEAGCSVSSGGRVPDWATPMPGSPPPCGTSTERTPFLCTRVRSTLCCLSWNGEGTQTLDGLRQNDAEGISYTVEFPESVTKLPVYEMPEPDWPAPVWRTDMQLISQTWP